jgi:cytochrome c2
MQRLLPLLLFCFCRLPVSAAAPFFDPSVPVHATPVDAGPAGAVARGLLVKAGEGWVVFDQDLLRPALWLRVPEGKPPVSLAMMAQASWDEPTRKGGVKLPVPSAPGLELAPALPGTGLALADLTADPRPVFGADPGRGPLDAWGRRFLGYHPAATTGVLSYRCGEVVVREWYEADRTSLRRHLAVGPGDEVLFIAARAGGATRVVSNHAGLKIETSGDLRIARLAASRQPRRVTLAYAAEAPAAPAATPAVPPARAVAGREESTRVTVAERSGPGWVLDRIALPATGPGKRRVRPADLVFTAPGRAAVVTFEGDVWSVLAEGGICRWRRVAAGLCEPLSIEQVDGTLQVFTRNGIVRLRDTDRDGTADFYENHSSLMLQTAGTRGYPLDMEVDRDGRTWCSIGGIATDSRSITSAAPANPHSGAILELPPDGSRLEVLARQAREPFFARDPETGRMAMCDQQGHWVPSSGMFPVMAGASFGYGRSEAQEGPAAAVWIPHDQDTSSASPLWLRGSAFSAWNGGVLHLSYGTGRLFLARLEESWPARAGAVIPLGIDTGLPLLHARVEPGDGSIWLAGFRIYDSRAPALEGIGRLRPARETSAEPVDARLVREGVVITFAAALDPASAVPAAVEAREWQYRRSSSYGSPRLKRDGSQGVDPVATGGTFLAKDGKSVFIHIPALRPTMQLEISHRFRGRGGKDEPRPLYFTVASPPPADWVALGFDPPALDAAVARIHTATPADATASAELGAAVSARYGCIACHSVDGRKDGHSGPTWKGLYGSERRFTAGPPAKADDAYLKEAILEPDKRIVAGYALGMGSYAGVLSEVELESILLYIRSLK